MKSLRKAIEVLEYLAENGSPATPTQIARALDTNAPSCVRILKEWCDMGYAQRVSHHAGYIAGPRLVAFGDLSNPYADLAKAAVGPLESLAKDFSSFATLSVLYRGRKYLIKHYAGSLDLRIQYHLSFEDVYTSASGRLLLALTDDNEKNFVWERHGAPGDNWEGIVTRDELNAKLDRVRKAGKIEYETNSPGKWVIATPILDPKVPLAVVGLPVQGRENLARADAKLRETSQAIIDLLTKNIALC